MTPVASAQSASEWCKKSELVSIIQEHQLTASASVKENLHLRVQLYWDVCIYAGRGGRAILDVDLRPLAC
jgi:hypothetical protein